MAKKILFHSAVYRFVQAAKNVALKSPNYESWNKFIESFDFKHVSKKEIILTFTYPYSGEYKFDFSNADFYFRGDDSEKVKIQFESNLVFNNDLVQDKNEGYFEKIVKDIAQTCNIK